MTTWIVTTDPNISPLVDIAQGQKVAVVVGNVPVGGVDRVVRIVQDDLPAEALAPQVVEAVAAEAGDMVLVLNNTAGRVLAGALAAAKGAPLLHGLLDLDSGSARLSRFGGITEQRVEFDVAVALVEPGEAVAGRSPEEEFAAQTSPFPLRVVSQDVGAGGLVNLAAATRIVGVGRGFAQADDLQLARDLAEAIGGEVGCTRPLVEGHGWFDRDSYLGVSGHTVAPEVYIAVGVSGQIHHTAGIDKSDTIVVINNDETAAIFDFADYGIVGDLYQVLPELTAALKNG